MFNRTKYDFDMLVIGGGSAGLSAASMAAAMGAKTALVEAEKMGGDCTWYGCVPSKALLKAAKIAHHIRSAEKFGLENLTPKLDITKVLQHVHNIQEHIYQDADAPENFEKKGVKVIHGRVRFLDDHKIEINGKDGKIQELTSRYFVIATGAKAFVPPIEGLSGVPYLTNETLFSIQKLPKKMIVVGGGPIGMEMAQAFHRFGSQVRVVDFLDRILSNDDAELAAILKDHLSASGIDFVLNSKANKFEQKNGIISVSVENRTSNKITELDADAVLMSVGRRPNIEYLNLAAAGVKSSNKGIEIDNRCRTSVSHIFACGDAAGSFQFTHYASHMAKVAVMNAILHLPTSVDAKHITWSTFTDPEIAHVGATEKELQESGRDFETYRLPFSKVDRAITDGETTGLIKVFAKKFNGEIYGASILGPHAGDLIAEYALAMRNGIKLSKISGTIHAYPTFALANRLAADQWYVGKNSKKRVRWLQRIFGYRGELPS